MMMERAKEARVTRRSAIVFKFRAVVKPSKDPDATKNLPTCKICQNEDSEHYSCADCDKQFFSRQAMTAHLRKHKHPPVTCPVCSLPFEFYHKLEKHLIKHSNERPFSCDMCRRTFKRHDTLVTHKRIHERKQFTCKVCPKMFAQKVQLDIHMRIHYGIKPYGCSVCSKDFAQVTSLNNHMLTHTGVKPHRCEHCGKWFRQVSNLKQHIERYHPDEDGYKTKKQKKKRIVTKLGYRNKSKKNIPKTSRNEDGSYNNSKRLSISLAWYSCKKCKKILTGRDKISMHKKMCS